MNMLFAAVKDKYIVDEPGTSNDIWWGKVNVSYREDRFETLLQKMKEYLKGKTVYVQDCYAGADQDCHYPLRIITTYAWHSIFAKNMFLPLREDSESQKE